MQFSNKNSKRFAKKLYRPIQRLNIVANLIYLGFAYLVKVLWRHKVSLNFQNGDAHKSSFDIFKPS